MGKRSTAAADIHSFDGGVLMLRHALVLSTAMSSMCVVSTARSEQSEEAKLAAIAESAYHDVYSSFEVGRVTQDELYTWSKRWLTAAMHAEPGKSIQFLEQHRDRMKKLHQKNESINATGVDHAHWPLSTTEYYVAEADYWVKKQRERSKPKAK